MPFKSEKQRRYLWANEPAIAEKWAHEQRVKARKGALDSITKKGKKAAADSK